MHTYKIEQGPRLRVTIHWWRKSDHCRPGKTYITSLTLQYKVTMNMKKKQLRIRGPLTRSSRVENSVRAGYKLPAQTVTVQLSPAHNKQ